MFHARLLSGRWPSVVLTNRRSMPVAVSAICNRIVRNAGRNVRTNGYAGQIIYLLLP